MKRNYLLLASLFLLTSCANTTSEESSSSNESSTTTIVESSSIIESSSSVEESSSIIESSSSEESDAKSIVIGMSGPLTGFAAVYGIVAQHSAEMAVEEINAAGGVNGYNVELITTDDKHDSSTIATNFASLMEQGMQVSLGTVTTRPGREFTKLTHEEGNRVFFMTPSATGDDIPQYDNGYQMCFSDNNQGKASAEYVNSNIDKSTKIGILYNSIDDYSIGIYEKFIGNISEKFNITTASFTDDTYNFNAQVNALKDCAFIFMPIYYTPASLFMRQAKGIISNDATYFGCDGFDGIDTAIEGFDIKTIPQEISYISHFNPNATEGKAKEYIDKFAIKYPGEEINQFGAAAYDCVYAITGALEEVAKKDASKVTPKTTASDMCDALIEVFQGGYNYTNGVTGASMTWDANGYVNKEGIKYIVKEKDSSEESGPSTEESSGVEESSSTLEVEPLVITLSGLTTKSGIDLSNTSEEFTNSVLNAFGDIVKSISYEKTFLEDYGIRLASSSYEGVMTIKLNNDSYKNVDIEARAFSKYDSYNKIYRTDTDVSFSVNDITFDVTSTAGEDTTLETFTYSSTDLIDELVISTISGRLIIDKITLY